MQPQVRPCATSKRQIPGVWPQQPGWEGREGKRVHAGGYQTLSFESIQNPVFLWYASPCSIVCMYCLYVLSVFVSQLEILPLGSTPNKAISYEPRCPPFHILIPQVDALLLTMVMAMVMATKTNNTQVLDTDVSGRPSMTPVNDKLRPKKPPHTGGIGGGWD